MYRHPASPSPVGVCVLAAVLSLASVPGALAGPPEPTPAGSAPPGASSPADPGSVDASASLLPLASPSAPASPAASAIAGAPDVTMRGSVFHPVTVEVRAGETVDWLNDDVTVHTVSALDGSFNSGIMAIGDAFSVTFATAGSFDYVCAIHPLMTGTVVVSP